MAVTSIWYVSNHMDTAIAYVINPEKTTEKPELSPEAISARKAVGDVINYASNADKTEKMMYVTGINCSPDSAVDEFMSTKEHWSKTGGRLAYHGYQSFLEGDGQITAEKAHEIGVKLAQELWGDRFEVVVATHLNTNHYHNHFILNSVSFRDGYKFRRTLEDYRQMRLVSDRLCRAARLHVVEDPSARKGKTYYEWRAERQGKKTVRGTIREDIDYAIRLSRCEMDFVKTMKELGYEFKFFKPDGSAYVHSGIKPPGAKSFFRFCNLGPNYDYDSIRRRIIQNTLVPGMPFLIERKPKQFKPNSDTGLPHSYRRYCLRLYALVCSPEDSIREYAPMAVREDVPKLDKYMEQMDFLYHNQIFTKQNLQSVRAELISELEELILERRKMYSIKKRAVRNNYGPLISETNKDISSISRKIRELRKNIAICDEIAASSEKVTECVDLPEKAPEPITQKQVINKKDQRKNQTL